MSDEQWLPVVGYEGLYEVSSAGRIRGCRRVVGAANGKTKVIKSKLMKLTEQPSGHLTLNLYKDRHKVGRLVHRLALEAFVGSQPDGHEGCHRNGDPADNSLANLYWGTRSENVLDSIQHGTHRWGSRSHCDRGHEFTPENTRPRSDGRGRECIACVRIWKSAFTARRRIARGVA